MMVTDAVIDRDAGMLFYLAFDLLLAEAPIRDGEVQIDESHVARATPDEPETAARHAAVRAALLNRFGSAFLPDRGAEISRSKMFAERAGLDAPAIPDDEVRTVTLHRHKPTKL